MNKRFKKAAAAALSLSMAFGMASCGAQKDSDTSVMKVAMITDNGDINDQGFNQTTYEACKEYADSAGKEFTYYKPAADSDADRKAMIEKAVADGYDVIVLPGFSFAAPVVETAPNYPDVKFVTLDITEADFCSAAGTESYSRENVYGAVYKGEISGYLAGYAAVKLGYDHLGFLGGMAVPQVIQFGCGFAQGADDAAAETGIKVTLDYAYANQFYGSEDITSAMNTWYSDGTQAVFACGGGIYTSVGEAAQAHGGKVIGVDVDQAPIIDAAYGDNVTVTSALKGLAPTVKTVLTGIDAGKWSDYSGKTESLGLVSADNLALNYVGLPSSTQWSDKFTEADYKVLVKSIIDGEHKINENYPSETPTVSNITLNYLGNLQ